MSQKTCHGTQKPQQELFWLVSKPKQELFWLVSKCGVRARNFLILSIDALYIFKFCLFYHDCFAQRQTDTKGNVEHGLTCPAGAYPMSHAPQGHAPCPMPRMCIPQAPQGHTQLWWQHTLFAHIVYIYKITHLFGWIWLFLAVWLNMTS